jgi:regulator of sigma D
MNIKGGKCFKYRNTSKLKNIEKLFIILVDYLSHGHYAFSPAEKYTAALQCCNFL